MIEEGFILDEILNIQELKTMAYPVIKIPGFDNISTIKVQVQRPKLMKMAAQGKIPNHLMNVAMTLIKGKSSTQNTEITPEKYIKELDSAIELYCMACLVKPSYEEFKEIMTDDQRAAIFNWGLGEVEVLNSFRENQKDGSSDHHGEALSQKAK